MKKIPLAVTLAVLAVMASASAAVAKPVSPDAPVTAQHAITCNWSGTWGGPFRVGPTAVNGAVQIYCSDRLDKANTAAQLQKYINGSFVNVGDPVISYATGPAIKVTDGTTGSTGTWRTQGTHFGQHGNIWSLPTYYSFTSYLQY